MQKWDLNIQTMNLSNLLSDNFNLNELAVQALQAISSVEYDKPASTHLHILIFLAIINSGVLWWKKKSLMLDNGDGYTIF